ncbi:TPA: hypothetical protein DEP86_01410 [Candidatus Uhrbacteria bacterium]|nr:hypothetical protein [Candidatus Uhrbacteria bacterium]
MKSRAYCQSLNDGLGWSITREAFWVQGIVKHIFKSLSVYVDEFPILSEKFRFLFLKLKE